MSVQAAQRRTISRCGAARLVARIAVAVFISTAFLAALLAVAGKTWLPATGTRLLKPDRAFAAANDSQQSLPQSIAETSPFGISAYAGGSNQYNSFFLPVVRSDSGYDTILHVADATASSTNFTLTLYNNDGSVFATSNQSLAAWASSDIDVSSVFPPGFAGAATLSASPNAIAVAADVISGTLTTDNLASYGGLPFADTTAFLPSVSKQASGLTSSIYVQNASGAPSTVTITFSNGVTTTMSLNTNGSSIVDVSTLAGLPTGFAGSASIQSTGQLVTAVTNSNDATWDLVLCGQSGALAPAVTGAVSKVFRLGSDSRIFAAHTIVELPHIAFNTTVGDATLTSTIAVTNPADSPGPADITVNFYDTNGNQITAATVSQSSVAPGGTASWYVPNIVGLSADQTYSAVASASQQVSATVTNTLSQGPFAEYADVDVSHLTANAYLPGIRKSIAGDSTAFTVMNTGSTLTTYQLNYWDASGNLVESSQVTIAPNASSYIAQFTDTNLPTGFEGSVQITSSGSTLATVVEEYAGYGYLPPTPTPTSTAIGAPTSTPTPIPTLQSSSANFTVPVTPTTVAVSLSNGEVTIDVPPGALGTAVPLGSTVLVSLSPVPATDIDGATPVLAFSLTLNANGSNLTTFSPPLGVTVTYDPSLVAADGLNPNQLHLYLNDTSSGTVTELPTAVDLVYHTLTANVPHLTVVSAAAPKSVVSVPIVLSNFTAASSGW
jgi:hypothetical protein